MCKHAGAEEVCRLGSGGSFALHTVWMGTMKAFAGGGWHGVEQFCPQLDKWQNQCLETLPQLGWGGAGDAGAYQEEARDVPIHPTMPRQPHPNKRTAQAKMSTVPS